MTTIDLSKALVGADKIAAFEPQVAEAQKALEEGTCKGNDFLGWLHLPSSITPEFISEIKTCAKNRLASEEQRTTHTLCWKQYRRGLPLRAYRLSQGCKFRRHQYFKVRHYD